MGNLREWSGFGKTEEGFLSKVRFERLPNIRLGNRGGRQARLLMNYLVKSASWGFGEGGPEELRHQSQQCQELSVDATGHQLIFKMSSEYQTVDHTNEIRGTITTRSLCDSGQRSGQHDTNFVSSAENANDFAQKSCPLDSDFK